MRTEPDGNNVADIVTAPADDDVIKQIVALERAGEVAAATDLAVSLWRSGTPAQRRWAAYRVPNVLASLERIEEALQIYNEAVAEGFTVGDFRTRSRRSSLARSDPDLAARLYRRDLDAFSATLRQIETGARLWAPVADAWGVVELRGATAHPTAGAIFELAVKGASTPRKVEAVLLQRIDHVTHWRASIEDLLPGQEAAIRLVAGDMASPPLRFVLPEMSEDQTLTGAGDAVGMGAAVLTGKAIPGSAAARYRFEYGGGEALDHATPWCSFPPPCTARAYRPLYRHTGDWMPTCFNPYWIRRETADGGLMDPGLAFGTPFAKDRNQLTGIGAHEMPVGFRWGRRADSGPTWGLGGDRLDLRDAELSFTIAGEALDQKGYVLHYWVSHEHTDEIGHFSSQWALTGAPFPDDALMDSTPRKVTLKLVNDPRAWTYTGNNPQEQGAHAQRYRRRPLDTSLGHSAAGSVLIYAFGDVRRPPTGAFVLYATDLRHRDYSLLSPAAQARLTAFPAGGFSDPNVLTAGQRGRDDQLWTSGPAPTFPLEFTWELTQGATLTHFHIGQHPYWPARDIEILATGSDGLSRTIWCGALSEGRPDRDEPHVLSEPLPGIAATAVTVRILSGHHPERCGLDSVAFYGDGVGFAPDGAPCTLSAEVGDLTPGAALTYRLVVEDGDEVKAGASASIVLPAQAAPVFESAQPLHRPRDPACYVVRANAMGLDTELWGELDAEGRIFSGPRVYLGSQPTGRHIYYVPEGLPPRAGAFRLRARNAAGEASMTVPWPLG